MTPEEKDGIEIIGKTPTGITIAKLADGTDCTIENVNIKLAVLEKLNESPYVGKVLAILETDPNDPQTATKIAIEDPLSDENASGSLRLMSKYVEQVAKSKDEDGKKVFKAVLVAMLDLRRRLPPIYTFSMDTILIDKQSGAVKICISEKLFVKQSAYKGLERSDLLYKSPEELLGKGKSLTTPFWVLGCVLYEAKFGFNPFRTHLKQQVTEMFIKSYPVMFPED